MRERERERERQTDRQTERECVCLHFTVSSKKLETFFNDLQQTTLQIIESENR